MPPRIAAAPCSYGVFEITVDSTGLPDGADLADAMASAGYAGTQLGPPGYFGEGPRGAELLGERGLELVGSFLPLRFSRAEAFADDLRGLEAGPPVLEEASEGRERPGRPALGRVLRARPDAHAGAIEAHPETWLGRGTPAAALRERRTARPSAAANAASSTSFHPHAGTYVETPREVDALLEAHGHEPARTLLRHRPLRVRRRRSARRCCASARELVNHVHFKDVDFDLLARMHAEGRGLEDAWAAGVFCALGTGGAHVDECLRQLLAAATTAGSSSSRIACSRPASRSPSCSRRPSTTARGCASAASDAIYSDERIASKTTLAIADCPFAVGWKNSTLCPRTMPRSGVTLPLCRVMRPSSGARRACTSGIDSNGKGTTWPTREQTLPVLDLLTTMTEASIETSGLDAQTLMLVRFRRSSRSTRRPPPTS